MSTHGNKPSRTAVDNVEFVQIPDSDPSEHGSTGNRKSRQPGDPIRSYSNAADLKFPEGRRYQQMGNPISGGMGVIFKALDLHLDIDVAIKRIRPKFASNEELIKRFEREAKIQVRLKHDHLVQVKDFQRDSNGPYIVMEWIEGQSLASAIKSSGAMQWRDAALLISKVAMALQVAHENDIIHRDVKPGNILLNKHGEPHITDFGLACADAGLKSGFVSGKNVAVGTEYFMSPEQLSVPARK